MSTPPEPAVAPPAASASAGPGPAPPPGVALDTSDSRRLPILMEMVAALSRADDPSEVLREFARGFARLDGPQGYLSLSTRNLAPGQYKITRMVSHEDPEQIAATDPWSEWSRLPAREGGWLGHVIRTAYPQVYHHLDLRDDPVLGDALARYRSMMAIPLFDGGEPLNWGISLREDPRGFTLRELEEAVLRSNLGGAAVRNTMITRELRKAHAAIRQEVAHIAAIQRALLPAEIPSVPGLDVDVSYETFDQAGGDMYALHPLRRKADASDRSGERDPAGPWAILIADVSGHGPAAAVIMAMMQSIIATYPGEPAGPAEVLEYCNRHLAAKRIEGRFVTAFAAVWDPSTRRLTYARAGHNPPVWMRPGAGEGTWDMARLDEVGGMPLGIIETVSYDETTVRLEPGQTLVLYTDGITEATGAGGAMFGVEGIEGSLTECTGWPQCVIGHITESLRRHQKGVRPTDDQTLLVARVG